MAEQKEAPTPGYMAPLHRSLTQPIYWMGVPRNLLLMEAFVAVFGGIILKTFTVPVLCVLVHFVFRFLGQQDKLFHQVFWRNKDYKSYYDP